jgi:hypothetical protein
MASPRNKIFSETILIAALTVAGYLAAFAYQWSYLSYFGLPVFLVDVNLGLVLAITLVALIYLASALFLLILVARWKPESCAGHLFRWIVWLVFLLVALFPVYLSPLLNPLFNFAAIGLIFIGSIISYKKIDKIEDNKEEGIFDKLEEEFGASVMAVILLGGLFIYFSYMMGAILAKSKSDFLVPSNNPNILIISTFDGNLVGVGFSTTTQNKLTDTMTLIDSDKISNEGILFKQQKIGPFVK